MQLIRGFIALLVAACLTLTVYLIATSSKGSAVRRTSALVPVSGSSFRHISAADSSQDADTNHDTVSTPSPSTSTPKYKFQLEELHRQFAFSTESPHDVLVFLHMQKTGGTIFGKNLIKNLQLTNPCRCSKPAADGSKRPLRCPCYAADGKRQWLFSRYTTGWMCGVHADFTEWNECLAAGKGDAVEGFHRKRRYLMMTILREPIERYVSEYLHTSRGATWSSSTLRCNGKSPTLEELPLCYRDESWEGVQLPEFLNCRYNLANNRQTRMLSNLSLVNCYDPENYESRERQETMLTSAMENLSKLAFFGLKEHTNETQFLFEHTFNLRFREPLGTLRPRTIHNTKQYYDLLKSSIQQQIEKNNGLDVRLYAYAKQLFFGRYEFAKRMRRSIGRPQ